MYERTPDGQSFFIENALHRYSIGNRTPGLRTNNDGSLDLWIGRDDPGLSGGPIGCRRRRGRSP
jgi:hypothetical protein